MPLQELGKLDVRKQGLRHLPLARRHAGPGSELEGHLGRDHEDDRTARSIVVDENYIRESILEPQADVVQGFEPIMPTFQGLLREREILGVIEFIKSLK